MQLPSIDRTPNVRSAGADLASAGANRVMPVAPVNPAVHVSPPLEPTPSVINKINPALDPNESGSVYNSVSDPTTRGMEVIPAEKDWTIHRPAPEKVEDPPPKPMSQVLMDHIRSMWTASASAVQLEQVQNQLMTPIAPTPSEAPGQLAKQSMVYKPSKINKTENI